MTTTRIPGCTVIRDSADFQALTNLSLQNPCLCIPTVLHLTYFSAVFHLLVTVNQNIHYLMIKLINTDSFSYFIKLVCFAPDSFHVCLRIHLHLLVSGFQQCSIPCVWVLQLKQVLNMCCVTGLFLNRSETLPPNLTRVLRNVEITQIIRKVF